MLLHPSRPPPLVFFLFGFYTKIQHCFKFVQLENILLLSLHLKVDKIIYAYVYAVVDKVINILYSRFHNTTIEGNYWKLQIVRLMYTNNGLALLALASNAVHKLWKWPRNDRNNPSGKVWLLSLLK